MLVSTPLTQRMASLLLLYREHRTSRRLIWDQPGNCNDGITTTLHSGIFPGLDRLITVDALPIGSGSPLCRAVPVRLSCRSMLKNTNAGVIDHLEACLDCSFLFSSK